MTPRALLILIISIFVLMAAFFYWLGGYVTTKKMAKVRKAVIIVEPAKAKTAALPIVPKKIKSPMVAIVMDDFGYNAKDLDLLFSIKEPITLSILPNLRYSREIARLGRLHGKDIILHMPLESLNPNMREEADTIRVGMSEKYILERLKKGIESIPGLSGVSNHEGSKATEDRLVMATILKHLKDNGLYFLDSLTSQKSVCSEMAGVIGARCVKRDMFLDNTDSPDYIEKQLLGLRKLAFRKGRAIAICHDRKNTIHVLAKLMPEMAKDGILFVSLSDMVR